MLDINIRTIWFESLESVVWINCEWFSLFFCHCSFRVLYLTLKVLGPVRTHFWQEGEENTYNIRGIVYQVRIFVPGKQVRLFSRTLTQTFLCQTTHISGFCAARFRVVYFSGTSKPCPRTAHLRTSYRSPFDLMIKKWPFSDHLEYHLHLMSLSTYTHL